MIRGAAILLMIVDHVLVLVDPDSLARSTVTRLSMPAFAIVTGYLWRARWTWRYAHLVAAALVAEVCGRLIGLGTPDVLLLIGAGYLALWLVEYSGLPPLVAIALAVLSWQHMPVGGMPDTWTNYHPNEVLAWMLLGRYLLEVEHVVRLPRVRWLEAIGRRPLAWYLGHLVVLAAAVIAWS